VVETCNNRDDDCNGRVDDGLVQSCYDGAAGTAGVGACRAGTQTCTTGAWGSCQGQVTPTAEICDGADNDCNGTIDRDVNGNLLTEACYSGPAGTAGVGLCRAGVRTCTGGAWSACVGEVLPTAEVCDGADNDCDGSTDEELGSTTCGLGPCLKTVQNCIGGVPQSCNPYAEATPEVCDGLDNDCDGVVDGIVRSCYRPATGCTETNGTWSCVGSCTPGIQVCAAGGGGVFTECQFDVGPSDEVCDGLDNDCDGQVDEDADGLPLSETCYPAGSGPGTGCTYDAGTDAWTCEGRCQAGVRTCGTGTWGDCAGAVTPAVETCDGSDNDCDGEVDEPEDIAGLGQPCGTALGRCTVGTLRCDDGVETCDGGTGPFPGACNGQDDDCDGEIDEPDEVAAEEGQPCGDTTGLCEPGVTRCVGGGLICLGGVSPGAEVCDGQDNDCDGVVDNDAPCPPDYYCVQGGCRPTCDPTREFPCPGLQQECRAIEIAGETVNLCVSSTTLCGGTTCPQGWRCVNDTCVNPCDPNPCEGWETCKEGTCIDESCTGIGGGCPADAYCVAHECRPDPCLGRPCDASSEYCVRDCSGAECVHRCEPLCDCTGEETCDADGQCVPDPCASVACEVDQRCAPATGDCEPDPCHAVLCSSGQRCHEGDCLDDPCNDVVCPDFFRCTLTPGAAPTARCEADDAFWVPGTPVTDYLATGGGGCACRTTSGPEGGLALLGFLGLLAWVRRRGARARRRSTGLPVRLVAVAALLGLAGAACALDPWQQGREGRWERPDASVGPNGDATLRDVAPDACVASPEVCDGVDNDCDGVIDDGFDLESDPNRCGGCDVVCGYENAHAECVAGDCVMGACLPGFWDLDGDPDNGCEYACFQTNGGAESCDGVDNDCDGEVDEDFDLLGDANHCGACFRTCSFFQGQGGCEQGECVIDRCRGGYVDKDGNPDNGCECMMDLVESAAPCTEGQAGDCAADEVCVDADDDGVAHCAATPLDVCDGVDNDCDGQIDEDAADVIGVQPCYEQPSGCVESSPGAFTCQGGCRAGARVCVGGRITCAGQVGPAAEVCDGADNDCNGVVDDGYRFLTDPMNCGGCGIRCSATVVNAVPACVAGACVVSACQPGHWDLNGLPGDGCEYPCTLTQGGVERCGDGVDNDCDGQVDEGFDLATDVRNCGACGNDCSQDLPYGTRVSGCVAGACQYLCVDGYVDRNGDLAQGRLGNGCEYPCVPTGGGVETCDGADNDCDGTVDEGFDKLADVLHCGGCDQRCADRVGVGSVVTGCLNGVCRFACAAGRVDVNGDVDLGSAGNGCECQITLGGVEACDGLDNDCDGIVDEDTGGAPLTRSCYGGEAGTEGVGPCRAGAQTCGVGVWGACTGEVVPTAELCDGVDNDCDGATDENASGQPLSRACYTGPAGTEDVGPCHGGTQTCAGGIYGTCGGQVTPQLEQCDGVDNDCDGSNNEDFALATDPLNCGACGHSCAADVGAFAVATGCLGGACQYICQANHFDRDGDRSLGAAGNGCEYACLPTNGGIEACGDGIDNDCDGLVDEGFDFTSDALNCGACGFACAAHTPINASAVGCSAGGCQFACLANRWDVDGDLALGEAGNGCEYVCTLSNGGHELCDNLDNDCDGVRDDSPEDANQPCGLSGVAPCRLGLTECRAGGNLVCVGNVDPEVEVCDGIDNDCDGTVDLDTCLTAGAADVRLDRTNGAGVSNSIQVDLAADGNLIHVVWLDRRNGNADIYHACSTNGGTTWTDDARLDGGGASIKPRVLLDPSGSGRVYVAWEDFRATGYRNIYFRTSPGCSQAFAAETQLDTGTIDSLNLDLAADGSGRVAVIWEDFVEGVGATASRRNLYLRASTDSGATWNAAPVKVNQVPVDPANAYATMPRLVYGQSHRLFVTWMDQRNVRPDIYVNRSDDNGATWQAADRRLDTDTAGAGASKFPRIATDGLGRVVVVWQDLRSGVSSRIYLNRSDDNGVDWLAADRWLDDEGAVHDSFEPLVGFGQPGYVHVSWQDFREGLPRLRVMTSADLGATWATSVIASQGDGNVSGTRLAADGMGKVFAAWIDDRDGLRDVYLNYSVDDGAHFQPVDLRLDVGSAAGVADSFSAVLAGGDEGNPYVVWVDTRTGGIQGDIYFNTASE
jgi:hypothetical protein